MVDELAYLTVVWGCVKSGLNKRIANFYDASSGLWEDIWGEHMHHGKATACTPGSRRDFEVDHSVSRWMFDCWLTDCW